MTHILWLSFLLTVVALAKAGDDEVSGKKYCDSTVDSDIQFEELKGEWWEKESFNTDSFVEFGDKCHASKIFVDGKKLHVVNDYLSGGKDHKQYSYTVINDDNENEGDFHATMNILKPALGKKKVEWDILETDYENFMLVQICYDGPGTDEDFKAGLLYVRRPVGDNLSSKAPEILAAELANNLEPSYFQANNLKKCQAPTFPDTFTAEESK